MNRAVMHSAPTSRVRTVRARPTDRDAAVVDAPDPVRDRASALSARRKRLPSAATVARRATARAVVGVVATAKNLPRRNAPPRSARNAHPRNVHLQNDHLRSAIARTASAVVAAATRTPNAGRVRLARTRNSRWTQKPQKQAANRIGSRGATAARTTARERKAGRATSTKTAHPSISIRASADRAAIAHRWPAAKVMSVVRNRSRNPSRKWLQACQAHRWHPRRSKPLRRRRPRILRLRSKAQSACPHSNRRRPTKQPTRTKHRAMKRLSMKHRDPSPRRLSSSYRRSKPPPKR